MPVAERTVQILSLWNIGPLRMKAYGLTADGTILDSAMEATAKAFIARDVVPSVTTMGDSSDLGFVIVHPGSEGLTISAHWWAQGSVLCQRMFRQLYGSDIPIDTRDRPTIGCVWELALTEAEHQAWRRHMMDVEADAEGYLAAVHTATQT